MTRERQAFLGILGLLLLAIFLYGGTRPLDNTDEGRGAQVTREMLERGDWVLPHLNGKPLAWKPMLYHWISGVASLPQRRVTELTARIPSILAAILCGFLTFDLGRRLFGSRRAGFIAAAVLLTSSQFLLKSINAQYDMTLTGCTTLAIAAFFRSTCARTTASQLGFSLLFYAAMGLGTITKGPVGILVPGMVAVAHHLSRREWLGILRTRPLPGILVTAAIAVPWYWAAYVRGGKEFIDEILWRQNLTRFTEAFDHQEGVSYYFVQFVGGAFPWSVFLVLAVAFLFVRGTRRFPPSARSRWSLRRRSRALFPLVWFVVVFALFTASTSKRSNYILPLFPAAALLVAGFFEVALRSPASLTNRVVTRSFAAMGFLLFLALPIVPIAVLRDGGARDVRDAIVLSVPAMVVLLFSGVSIVLAGRMGRVAAAIRGLVASSLLVHLVAFFTFLPSLDGPSDARSFAQASRLAAGPSGEIVFYRTFSPGLLFYLGGPMDRIADPETLISKLSSSRHPIYVVLKMKNRPVDWPPEEHVAVDTLFVRRLGTHDYGLARVALTRQIER